MLELHIRTCIKLSFDELTSRKTTAIWCRITHLEYWSQQSSW